MQDTIPNELKILQAGDVVADHTVIRCEPKGWRIPGQQYASWAAILESNREGSWHKYVTWIVIARPEGFVAECGHYFQAHQENEAYADYQLR